MQGLLVKKPDRECGASLVEYALIVSILSFSALIIPQLLSSSLPDRLVVSALNYDVANPWGQSDGSSNVSSLVAPSPARALADPNWVAPSPLTFSSPMAAPAKANAGGDDDDTVDVGGGTDSVTKVLDAIPVSLDTSGGRDPDDQMANGQAK